VEFAALDLAVTCGIADFPVIFQDIHQLC
jgi:hypothetical protein